MTDAEKISDAMRRWADAQPLRRFLTYRLSVTQSKLNAQATRYLREQVGLTLTQWRVIALIGGAGETTLTELCRTSALDKGLVSRRVSALTEAGVINAAEDEQDHRVQRLSLSEKGREIFARTLPKMQARQAFLNASLEPEELETLMRALDKLELAAEVTEFE
ncbi:MAG: MarR family winged helix-turn-helix transcriptional regulator [Pseudomonadota bacterium]